MPSGKVHDRITVIAAAAAVPVWWFAAVDHKTWSVGASLVGGILFSGMMISPDLDLDSAVYRRWGPLRFLWWPYQRLVPHRSWVSHSWLAGPIVRVAYFVLVLWLIALALLFVLSHVTDAAPVTPVRTPVQLGMDLWVRFPDQVTFAAIGILIGTGLHTGADAIVTGLKKAF